jgi:hypothetical protein
MLVKAHGNMHTQPVGEQRKYFKHIGAMLAAHLPHVHLQCSACGCSGAIQNAVLT